VPNLSLSDFIAPGGTKKDYIGLFAVTAGIGIEEWIAKYEAEYDHYRSILLKILTDRLAEAFAEELHERVRKEFWGYESNENLSVRQMLKEEYKGIRPAPGYPACPEHSEKRVLFDLLQVEKNTGIFMTENYAMSPAASVCGYYFSHPFSRYFNLGKLLNDQVEDYAGRKGISLDECQRVLNQNLF
jgi:5-methyltetrahydrofolate--homocysteine methyltransferase